MIPKSRAAKIDLIFFSICTVFSVIALVKTGGYFIPALIGIIIYIFLVSAYEIVAYFLRWPHLKAYHVIYSAVLLISPW